MFYIIGFWLAVILLINLASVIRMIARRLLKMFRRNIISVSNLFVNNYIDSKAFYMYKFNEIPCITFINNIDVSKASEYIRAYMSNEIVVVYQYNHYNHEANELQFNLSIFVLSGRRMVEMGNGYVEVLHSSSQYGFATELVRSLAAFRIESEEHVGETFGPVQVAGFMRTAEMN